MYITFWVCLFSVYFFFLPATILTAMYHGVHCHILLVNYEVMFRALITCHSEDPKLCIDLLRCAKPVVCNVNSNGNLFYKCNQPYLFWKKATFISIVCLYHGAVFRDWLPVVILASLRVVFFIVCLFICLSICLCVLKMPEGASSLETEAQIVSFCPCGTFLFYFFFFFF